MKKRKIIALVGPTGSGKTEWAKKIARKFKGRLISADSRQIYRGMDIGTGKVNDFEQAMVDIVEPSDRFTVWDYQKIANEAINQYLLANTLPILVGGAGLYLDAVLYGYLIPNIGVQSEKFRKRLVKIEASKLYQKLARLDSAAALKIDPKNKRRIIRALEILELTRRPFSKSQKKQPPEFEVLIIGIKTDRQTLYARIDARIDRMLKDGLVEEVRGLIKKYQRDLPSLNTIGYKEIIDYLGGRLTLKEAVSKIKTNTHDYVRRQETWFRKNKDIKWVNNYDEAEKLVERFVRP